MMRRHPRNVEAKTGLRKLRSRATLACCLAVAAALTAAGCASSSASPPAQSAMSAANQAALQNPNLDLGTSLYGEHAPDIKLVNQFGQPMSLSQFRGRVVILAFSDSECTTVCPLTTQSMVLAKELLGKAGESVQLLGVDANPDAIKVSDVMAYSRAHAMVNQWDFLTGSSAQLKAVWKAYNIEVQIEAGQIDHTPALYVINQQGVLEKLYLTTMAYSSVTQSAQVLASEVSTLLPSHPKLSSIESLATIPAQTPASAVTLPQAQMVGREGQGPAYGHPRPRQAAAGRLLRHLADRDLRPVGRADRPQRLRQSGNGQAPARADGSRRDGDRAVRGGGERLPGHARAA